MIFRLIISSLLIFQFPISSNGQNETPVHLENDKYNVVIFPASSKDFFFGNGRFTPSKQEIDSAEVALIRQCKDLNAERLNQENTPVIDKNLRKYKRQYFGYVNKEGNKILFINCFWRKEKEESSIWLQERIQVLDGGSYFWNVKYNLVKNELFDLDVNKE